MTQVILTIENIVEIDSIAALIADGLLTTDDETF